MTDNSKKRNSSFRRLFPNLFSSHKSKEKKQDKDSRADLKVRDSSVKLNQYESPRSFKNDDYVDTNSDSNLYENLSVINRQKSNNETTCNGHTSNHSSSSTLVSDSVQIRNNHTRSSKTDSSRIKVDDQVYAARPQVPRKPLNEISYSQHNQKYASNSVGSPRYPDVYYHSLEKLNDKITPLDEIEIYKASQIRADPEPVGAEIKKVCTKFHISPKKEAEVRTIQPTRARSLSLDHKGRKIQESKTENDKHKPIQTKQNIKPYNYSAPTSPIPTNHKIPSMPKTVSPYEHVRKNIMEVEERRNSLRKLSLRTKLTPSPRSQSTRDNLQSPMRTSPKDSLKIEEMLQRERSRKKVEAFYWQKLKELKQKEDDYYMRQSLNISAGSPIKSHTSCSDSNCSTPNSFQHRSNSIPRGADLSPSMNQLNYSHSPFIRGSMERRTDTYVGSRSAHADHNIVYRHPEKMQLMNISPVTVIYSGNNTMASYQSGSLKRDSNSNQHAKRVSFDEVSATKNASNIEMGKRDTKTAYENNYERFNSSSGIRSMNTILKMREPSRGSLRSPPQPPVRSTSYGTAGKILNNKTLHSFRGGHSVYSESESGSEAGEIQRILQNNTEKEEDWHADGSKIDGGLSDGEATRGPPRGRASRRDDPRRHTLAGNHLYVHPHHQNKINAVDMERYRLEPNAPEYATVTKFRDSRQSQNVDPRMRKPPLPRSYPPPTNALLFDDDPGIMSEVETSSTGFRRGGKQRSSLPVVRTPSKTLERPLGLVFLQYRNETKRALLPNEITSIDTVKALFVRSFPKQLTMQYMDSPMVKIYIHDSSKDMFYELEDVRAHLRDIRDRSVLRLFEATDMGGGVFPGAVGVGSLAMPPGAATCSGPSSWDQDQSYFSEPEIDSEYHHQHVHKSKVKAPAYYMGTPAPTTLPRGGSLLRAFSPAAPPVPADRVKTLPGTGVPPSKPLRSHVAGSVSERCFPFTAAECPRGPEQLYTLPGHSSEGYMSSPERGAARAPYEDPYYTQFLGPAPVRTNIAPVIDEEATEAVIIDDAYQMYGVNAITTAPRPMPRPPYDTRMATPQVDDIQRLRVEKMERQLANLTGLVQKALQVPGPSAAPAAAPRQEFPTYPARPANQDAARFASNERPPKLGRDKFQKSVSFEKSVSFSDDPPDMNSPKQHSPQHSADTKPTKPAIKSSTLPRTSSQERDRLKPAPPPKPAGLVGQQLTLPQQKTYTINVSPDFFNQLRVLQKQSRDLRIETRNLRRSTLSHAIQMRQLMAETIVKIGALAASFTEQDPDSQLTREEEIYRQDMLLLENDLYELEATVERLRGQAANRETRVNMADIERIAMVLSKSSKTVADWKLKFPILQDTMKVKLAAEMEKVVRKEKMLEDEPERLELALRRCKKLTGTLVTLKRLACVQEQRLPISDGRISPGSSQSSSFTAGPSSEEFTSESTCHMSQAHNKFAWRHSNYFREAIVINESPGTARSAWNGGQGTAGRAARGAADLRPENALDALLDELQTFAEPATGAGARAGGGGARGDDPLRRLHSYPSGSDTDASPPVRARGQHPPKPPVPERHPDLLAMAARRAPLPPPPPPPRTTSRSPLASPTSPASPADPDAEESASRQVLLEQRHQELLKKQRALQEQYARLQMIQRSGAAMPPAAQQELKKTGSESNLLSEMSLNLCEVGDVSDSMTQLGGHAECAAGGGGAADRSPQDAAGSTAVPTTNKVYETDIL